MTKNWVHWAELDICDSSLLCQKKDLTRCLMIDNECDVFKKATVFLSRIYFYTGSTYIPLLWNSRSLENKSKGNKNWLITSSNSPLCLFLESYSWIADFLVLSSLLIPSPHQPHGKTREVRNLYPYGKARNEEILWFSSPFCHDHQPMRKF